MSNGGRHFDKLSFIKYMKNIGRPYRKQATELVSICRTFAAVGEGSLRQDKDLRRVLEVADDALSSASVAKNKTSEATDKKFEEAMNALSVYERNFHSMQRNSVNGQQNAIDKRLPVAERMKIAKKNDDKSSSEILNKLKQVFKPVKGPTQTARFLLPGSLTDSLPKVVEQELGEETRMEEVLWNFSRLKEGDKRITLKQNPHFYTNLPRSARGYSGGYTNDPIERFWDAGDIWVLTHERCRVFLDGKTTDGKTRKRSFGNFWVPDEAIIFKDVCGRLEGEDVVKAIVQDTPDLWHREEPPKKSSSPVIRSATGPANLSDLPPLITNPVMGKTFDDWRQLVRDALDSPHISIRISAKGTLPESQDDWVLSSPTNATPSSPKQPFSIIQANTTGASRRTTAPQLPALRIPEPSPAPLTAQSYKSARSAFSPNSRTPLTDLNVIPPHFGPPPTTSPRQPSAAVSHSPARLQPISVSLSVTTPTSPRAKFVIPPRPSEPPIQEVALTGTAPTPTTGGIAPSPPKTAPTPSTNDLAPPSRLHAGDSQVEDRTSVPVSLPTTTEVQASSAAAPPPQTQGKPTSWYKKIQKYFWG